jgi:hypothetical protein
MDVAMIITCAAAACSSVRDANLQVSLMLQVSQNSRARKGRASQITESGLNVMRRREGVGVVTQRNAS